jgi:hypothetical protein
MPARVGSALSSARTVAQKDGKAIIVGAGRDVAKKYAKDHASRKPPERVTQDWKRG